MLTPLILRSLIDSFLSMDPRYTPRTRPDDTSVGPFDALVLAVTPDLVSRTSSSSTPVNQGERWVITSPNMSHVPAVQLGTQHVYARRDGRFGFNDFTLVPQIFCGEYAHHCCAPEPTAGGRPGSSDRRILWVTPTRKDFAPVKGSVFAGLGNLRPELVDKFSRMYDSLHRRAMDYKAAAGAQDAMTKMVAVLVSALRLALVRLRCAPCTFRDLVLQVADFQRRYIDLESFLLYYTKVQRRHTLPLEQRDHDVHEVDPSLMGAFCFQPSDVQWLFEAGIPVWYLRPESTITADTNIIEQVPISPPDPPLCLDLWVEHGIEVPPKVIYTGFPGVHLQTALRKASQHLTDTPDPTRGPAPESSSLSATWVNAAAGSSSSSLPPPPTSSSRPSPVSRPPSPPAIAAASMVSSSSSPEVGLAATALVSMSAGRGGTSPATVERKRKRDPYQGRNDFEEPVSDIMPPAIPVWQEALATVDGEIQSKKGKTKGPAVGAKPTATIGYHFPNPRTFVSTSSSRLASYLVAWLASRAAWTYKVTTEACAGKLLTATGAQWRDWLSCARQVENPTDKLAHPTWTIANPTANQPKDTRAARSRTAAWGMFKLYMPDTSFPDQLFWHERELQAGRMHSLEPEITAEILWDLFEHNFRFELVALDRAQLESRWRDEDWARDRDELLRSLFPGGVGYLVEGRPTQNLGLAAENWKTRAPFLQIFRDIVRLWHNSPKHLNSIKLGPSPDFRDVARLENMLVTFYCRTFYATFSRAPIVPHRLPPRQQ